MTLYKVVLRYSYKYQDSFEFLVVANDISNAVSLAEQKFKAYNYGQCVLGSVEVIATEKQGIYSSILLVDYSAMNLNQPSISGCYTYERKD